MWIFAEERAHAVLNGRHTGHTTDQHHFVDIARVQTCIGKRLLDRRNRAVNEVSHQLFELGAGQGHHQVLGTTRIRCEVRQVDFGLHHGR